MNESTLGAASTAQAVPPLSPTAPFRIPSPTWLADVLAYEAPFLVQKLIQGNVVATREEARQLFGEVKKFLILSFAGNRSYSIASLRVDEIWHQFVLFTAEYTAFGERFFGGYLHHSPSNAPTLVGLSSSLATRAEFASDYLAVFGEPPGDPWRDELAVSLDRRLALDPAVRKTAAVRVVGAKAELTRAQGDEDAFVCVRLAALFTPALEFIVRTPCFFVRELPAPLEDDERLELCRILVREKVLRIAR